MTADLDRAALIAERDALIEGYEAILDNMEYAGRFFRLLAQDFADVCEANRRLAAQLRALGVKLPGDDADA